MPIYEFVCSKCGEEFEEIVNSSQKTIPCPKCASARTKKRMSACSFKSSGSGKTASAASGGCGSCSSKNCSSCR